MTKRGWLRRALTHIERELACVPEWKRNTLVPHYLHRRGDKIPMDAERGK